MNATDIGVNSPAVMVADALITHGIRKPGPGPVDDLASFIVDSLAQWDHEILPTAASDRGTLTAADMVADALRVYSRLRPGPGPLDGLASFIVDYLGDLDYEIRPVATTADTAAELVGGQR